MKILMLTPYLPYPLVTGGQTRSYNLIKRMAKLGRKITLFSLIKDESERVNVPELEKFCEEVQVFKRSKTPWTLKNILRTGFSWHPFLVIRNWASGEKAAIKQKLESQKFDLIHAETFYVMPHIPKTELPILLVEQTIEFLVYRHFAQSSSMLPLKPLLYYDVAKTKYWELEYWKKANKVVAMSEEDTKIMLKELPSLNVDIVPNGVDTDFFSQKVADKSKQPVILYLGNFTWLQNREAVDVLIRRIWPKIKQEVKSAKLWIIGKEAERFFTHLKSEDIRVEEVKDVRSVYQEATVLVAPIYGSGGTRYKNFEAFASSLPVITTSIGIGGTEATNGKEVIICDDPEEIIKETVKLLKDPRRQKELAKNAKEMVRKKYDWDPIVAKLDSLYKEVARK